MDRGVASTSSIADDPKQTLGERSKPTPKSIGSDIRSTSI
jgi:hypothetical protein